MHSSFYKRVYQFILIFTILSVMIVDFFPSGINAVASSADTVSSAQATFNKTSATDKANAELNYIKTDPTLNAAAKQLNVKPQYLYDVLNNKKTDDKLLNKYFDIKIGLDRKAMENQLNSLKKNQTKASGISAFSAAEIAANKENANQILTLENKLAQQSSIDKSGVVSSGTKTSGMSANGLLGTPVTRFDPGDILTESNYKVAGMDIYIGMGHTAVYVGDDYYGQNMALIESWPCPSAPNWWDGWGAWAYYRAVGCQGGLGKDGVQRYPLNSPRWTNHFYNDGVYRFASWLSNSNSSQRQSAANTAKGLIGRPYSNPFFTGFNKWSYSQICSQVAYTSWINNGFDVSYWWNPIVSPSIVLSMTNITSRW